MKLIQEYIDKIQGSDKYLFLKKLTRICKELKINPNWLLAVMNSESGFNPAAVNPNGGASGLIQFMPSTAEWLGTSTAELVKMPGTRQLDYVKEYYLRNIKAGSKIESYEDLYLVTFYPYALKKRDSYVFGSEKSQAYAKLVAEANPAMDFDKNGLINRLEFRHFIYRTKIKDKIGDKSFKLLTASPNRGIPWLPVLLLTGTMILPVITSQDKKRYAL